MRSKFIIIFCGLWLCATALGQAPPSAESFQAADVHVSPAGTARSGAFLPNGKVEFRATPLLRLIAIGYNLPADRIVGGPNWLDADRFDVTAKAARPPSPATARAMLRQLLADRFQLETRQAEKPMPVYALVPGKHGVRKSSSAVGDPQCKSGWEENMHTYACRHVTLPSLAEGLPGIAPLYFDRPVVDRTGLTGVYDFTLRWLPRAQLPPGGESNSSHLFASIERELGIKVEPQTSPMPVLTIVRVDRTPVPNPPGVWDILGAPPTEFDVASIRRSRPGEKQASRIENGRIEARAFTLKDMIAFAYNVEPDWVRGGDHWVESDRFDISAKTAPTEAVDTLRTLAQSLLGQRFGLKVHREAQPVAIYALVAGKAKLKEADPTTRSTCRFGNADGGHAYLCQNTTMAQFAAAVRNLAGGILEHPVVDLTDLKGSYDFALHWSPDAGKQAGPATNRPNNALVPADGAPGFTLFEAIDRQLGLKLKAQKYPMQVIVVDHANRIPTEN